jgi:hypothetical protein
MNEAQIETIDQLINEQNRTFKSGIQKRIWVMVGLLVFVIGYMTFITISLARSVTPDNVSDIMVGAMVENAPAARKNMVTVAEDSIPAVVDTGVQQLYGLLPEVRKLLLYQVEASLPQLSEEFYQILADDIDKYFTEQDMVVSSLIEKIDNKEKREKLLNDIEVLLKRDISMFMTEAVYETKSLEGKLKTLIETPEKNLTAEEKKMKEILIYFLYLIKTEKG